MTITCGIQPTGVYTMAMKVLHNTCNMCVHNMPDMNALIPGLWAYISGKSLMLMLQLIHVHCSHLLLNRHFCTNILRNYVFTLLFTGQNFYKFNFEDLCNKIVNPYNFNVLYELPEAVMSIC